MGTAFDAEVDYVIVGAGSVLADRLSADGQHQVLVLEFGGKDNSIFIQMPAAFSIPMNKPRFDWGLYTEPEPGLKGRRLHQARGKVIGGSSSINGMAYVRGGAGDYAEWVEHGAEGWGYAEVLPYFRRAEDCLYGEDDYRGTGGPLGVCNGNNMHNPLYRAFIEAGRQAGYGESEDYNGYRQEGFCRMDMTVRDGMRCSTANAYLKPALARSNLRLEMHALTTCVLLDGRRAVGVEYRQKGRVLRVRARLEVVLSASAFNSPKLLMLSGIGPADPLRRHGIEVVHDLPGAIAYDGSSAAEGHGFQVHLGANKPHSRGRVELTSADPQAAPRLMFNYLQEVADRQAYRDGLRLTREIFAQPAFDAYRGEELSPGPEVQSDAQIDDWVAGSAETAYHPCGTCRMGTDAMAVVDPQCRVQGIDNLWVVDSSIMPTVTNGNINAPTIMIGEKAADLILGQSPLPPAEVAAFVPADWQHKQREARPERQG